MTDAGARDFVPRVSPPMDFLELAPDIGFCRIGEEAVFLDLRRDRYFRLAGDGANLLWSLQARPDEPVERGWAKRLAQTGLFRPCAKGSRVNAAAHDVIQDSLIDGGERGAVAFTTLPGLAVSLALIRSRLRRNQLCKLVGEHRKAAGAELSAPDDTAESWTRTFLATRALIPVPPNCLPDSLALARFLRRRNVAAKLVFGVRLAPFTAHCWLQRGATILNDSIDNAAEFTPILVV